MRATDVTGQSFTDWLKTQNPETRFDYVSNDNCVFAQYLKAMGFQRVSVNPWTFWVGISEHSLPRNVNAAIRYGAKGDDRLRSFGQVLEGLAEYGYV